jgi:hypothetical protein
MNRLPVTVLSGFPGAGKASLRSRCRFLRSEIDLFIQYNFHTDLSGFGNNINLGFS